MTKENATKKHEKAETKTDVPVKRNEPSVPAFSISPFVFMRRFAEDMERLFRNV